MKNNYQNTDGINLAMSSVDEIPTPTENASEIIALIKEKGSVTGYKLTNGKTISKTEAIALARKGEIRGVAIARNNGVEYLKSIPDRDRSNNLSNLPTV